MVGACPLSSARTASPGAGSEAELLWEPPTGRLCPEQGLGDPAAVTPQR